LNIVQYLFIMVFLKEGYLMARRSDHNRDELRSMALEAAYEIIVREGEKNLTTRKVAARIGYSVGTLYLIFKNLDDLKLALNIQSITRLRSRLLEATGDIADPAEQLKAMAHYYLDFGLQRPNLWRLMFEHQMPGDDPMPETITRATDALLNLLVDRFGKLMPGAEPQDVLQVTAAYWSALHGVTHLVITEKLQLGHVDSAHDVLQRQMDILFRGLTTSGSAPGN
jgi:AcrR family transcriptional regulator